MSTQVIEWIIAQVIAEVAKQIEAHVTTKESPIGLSQVKTLPAFKV